MNMGQNKNQLEKEPREVVDIERERIYIVQGTAILSSRDFEGNVYDSSGEIVGKIEY